MNAAPSTTSIDAVAQALADPTRRAILRLVRDDERSAGELATEFTKISRPAVSQHLRVLQDAGLLQARVDGKRRMYRAATDGLFDLRQFLDEMWSEQLNRLKVAAERVEWSERQQSQLNARRRAGAAADDAQPTAEEGRNV